MEIVREDCSKRVNSHRRFCFLSVNLSRSHFYTHHTRIRSHRSRDKNQLIALFGTRDYCLFL